MQSIEENGKSGHFLEYCSIMAISMRILVRILFPAYQYLLSILLKFSLVRLISLPTELEATRKLQSPPTCKFVLLSLFLEILEIVHSQIH